MNAKQCIADLKAHGLPRQQDIVEALRKIGVTVSQAHISRLENGVHKDPRIKLALGLTALHARWCGGRRK